MATDISALDKRHGELREAMRAACEPFDSAYWQRVDEERAYPEEFVQALTLAGWLSALIPREYGGSGLGLSQASVILEEINRSGANAGACHGQMYAMHTLRHLVFNAPSGRTRACSSRWRRPTSKPRPPT